VTTPGHAAAGATMWSVAWRLLSVTTDGFKGSSTVCRAPSEAEDYEADPSFTIAATDPLSSRTLPDGWLCASHTAGYPYLATSYQRSVDLSGTVLRAPIPHGWVLSVQRRSVDLSGLTCFWSDLRWVQGPERQVTVDRRDGAFICADRA